MPIARPSSVHEMNVVEPAACSCTALVCSAAPASMRNASPDVATTDIARMSSEAWAPTLNAAPSPRNVHTVVEATAPVRVAP